MSNINHPSHYGGENNPYEVVKVIEDWGLHRDFYVANAIKYIARAGKKGDIIEDLNKAIWYLKARAKIEYSYIHCYPQMQLADVFKNWDLSINLERAIIYIHRSFVGLNGLCSDTAIKLAIENIQSEINRLNNERS